jgi:tetratricopeptide (TPR) repeat protein
MLRGDLDQAKDYLVRAVALATENGNKWYEGQALRTLGRCYIAIEDPEKALEKAREALALAEQIGDRQAICESRLISAEAHLLMRDLDECSRELQRVAADTTDSATDLGFTGEAHRLNGMLNMAMPLLRPSILAVAFRSSTCSAIDIAEPVHISSWAARTRRFCRIAQVST